MQSHRPLYQYSVFTSSSVTAATTTIPNATSTTTTTTTTTTTATITTACILLLLLLQLAYYLIPGLSPPLPTLKQYFHFNSIWCVAMAFIQLVYTHTETHMHGLVQPWDHLHPPRDHGFNSCLFVRHFLHFQRWTFQRSHHICSRKFIS